MSNRQSVSNLFSVTPTSDASNLKGSPDLFLLPIHSPSVAQELIAVARSLVEPRGRGIYATDETPDAIESVLVAAHGADPEAETRPAHEKLRRRKIWREDAYETLSSEYISGVILQDETLLDFGLAPILTNKGIVPGVRANGELAAFSHSPFEHFVQGLDGLLPKLQAARAAGAGFAKWRVPVACTSPELGLPTQLSLEVQADTLAAFAAISQQAGLVPIVEPDVDFAEDASLGRSVEIHERIIRLIYTKCVERGVLLEGSLIKPSFPQPGKKHLTRATVTPEEIGLATASLISHCVPSAVPGVMFLSGGLSSATAVSYLNAVNVLVNSAAPSSPFSRLPPLAFSFGRAIQGEPMKYWVKGDVEGMKKSFEETTRACWKAAKGEA